MPGGADESGGASAAGGRSGTGGSPVAGGVAGAAGGGTGGGEPFDPFASNCQKARSKEHLIARSIAMSGEDAGPRDRIVFTETIYNAFRSSCGACHVDAALGGFEGKRINFDNFAELVGNSALDRIREDKDLTKVMPPGGKLWGQRRETDPEYQLAELLAQWLDAGRPKDKFTIRVESGSSDRYPLPDQVGANLTNIGNCIPSARTFALESDRSLDLDDLFEEMTTLPLKLEETDLFTLDSKELALYGVVAFVPSYPLWSDDAGKLRHVRVPRGRTIYFDKKAQEFRIPPNTRFYKTFFKEIIDTDGSKVAKKIETRIIVSRPDECSEGACKPTALMGSYAWNDDESQAELIQDPRRNGEPFADRIVTYFTDEQRAQEVLDDPVELAKVSRRYAIPGKERCIQCHMGAPNGSFVLGFTPLQIRRWPYVEEKDMSAPGSQLKGYGVLAETAPDGDELTQLERLIEYGVISQVTDPNLIVSLRDSQNNPPRNGYELKAQAYLMGNCAHCHNPRGFPSVENPSLRDVLNFYPSKGGGIFGFPLDKFSPRIVRGHNGQIPIPYVTPSLYDLDCDVLSKQLAAAGEDGAAACPNLLHDGDLVASYRPKYVGAEGTNRYYIKAPWRSLIYRNVDTPFTYMDHLAFFPHMPQNTPGFDCRAPRILGDWMVSIPAKLKKLGVYEPLSTEPQTYEEVLPSSGSEYSSAIAEARRRLEAYHDSERYGYCPDTTDIIDPSVPDQHLTPSDDGQLLSAYPEPWQDNVPDRGHWLIVDSSDPEADTWTPRRPDWEDVLLSSSATPSSSLEAMALQVINGSNIRLTPEFRTWAVKEQPYAFWKNSEGQCDAVFQTQPTLAALTAPKPRWSFLLEYQDRQSDPVYSLAPGPAVFLNICSNCHGANGNGQSNLANTIFSLTGGETRVANLRDGILGPTGSPGANRAREFGPGATALGIEVDDLAVRYMTWMGLGGTQRNLPAAALISVGNTQMAGHRRENDPTVGTPNMLQTANQLCRAALPTFSKPDGTYRKTPFELEENHQGFAGASPLIRGTGDEEMWLGICSRGRKTPVRVIDVTLLPDTPEPDVRVSVALGTDINASDIYDPEVYGNRPVRTRKGVANGVSADDILAWCSLQKDPADTDGFDDYGNPYCPDPQTLSPPRTWDEVLLSAEQQEAWAMRGAINAGMAVFVYLDAIAKGNKPALEYNECLKLADAP